MNFKTHSDLRCKEGLNVTNVLNTTTGLVEATCVDVDECATVLGLCDAYANLTLVGANRSAAGGREVRMD